MTWAREMRIGIISDIHSNLEALEVILRDIDLQKIDRVWCLGDIVGYGPDPNECIDLVRSNIDICVMGNHDQTMVGVLEHFDFNPDAEKAFLWTRTILTEDNKEYIKTLPLKLEIGDFTLVHGSPREPFEYITSSFEADEALQYLKSLYCLIGHSHVPMIITLGEKTKRRNNYLTNLRKFTLTEHATFINPGSVGQSRDGNPKASYMIYDSDLNQVTHRRVAYDVNRPRQKMKSVGLPEWLGDRLLIGL
ncbi:metallophosphoesterase family protein [Chloroflexota bacterium]